MTAGAPGPPPAAPQPDSGKGSCPLSEPPGHRRQPSPPRDKGATRLGPGRAGSGKARQAGKDPKTNIRHLKPFVTTPLLYFLNCHWVVSPQSPAPMTPGTKGSKSRVLLPTGLRTETALGPAETPPEEVGPSVRQGLGRQPLPGAPLPPVCLPISTGSSPSGPPPSLPNHTPWSRLSTPPSTRRVPGRNSVYPDNKLFDPDADLLLIPSISSASSRLHMRPLTDIWGEKRGLAGEAGSRRQGGHTRGLGIRVTPVQAGGSRKVGVAPHWEGSQSFEGDPHALPGWP